MKVAAIICECNPLHNGHTHIFHYAKKELMADYVIALMSGDYVQRGEPAIINKYDRTSALLQNGADLVLELPLVYAVGGADYFARGAMTLLSKLGIVTDLCFGSESGNLEAMMNIARLLANEPPAFSSALKTYLKDGCSFPLAREKALQSCGYEASVLSTPNDTLGVEYIKTALSLSMGLTFHAIPRVQALHASTLRDLASESVDGPMDSLLTDAMPIAMSERMLSNWGSHTPVVLDDFSEVLLYALQMNPSWKNCLDVSENLKNRIERMLLGYRSFSSFALQLKSKDYTLTRVKRALLHIVLDIHKEEMDAYEDAGLIGYARILGLKKEQGSQTSALLRLLGQTSKIPLITKVAGAKEKLDVPFSSMFEKELQAADLYEHIVRMKYRPLEDKPLLSEYEQQIRVVSS